MSEQEAVNMINMKKIILSVIVMAFAVAAQADDAKTCQVKDKDKPACCPSKTKTSDEAKGCCPFAKNASCKQAPAKQVAVQSPKAAADASK
jgi:hypothetical protein